MLQCPHTKYQMKEMRQQQLSIPRHGLITKQKIRSLSGDGENIKCHGGWGVTMCCHGGWEQQNCYLQTTSKYLSTKF